MERRVRIELEVRVVLVTWRAVMRRARDGRLPDSRESIHRATVRALEFLDGIDAKYPDHLIEDHRYLARVLAPARAEIHGALNQDVADPATSAQAAEPAD